MQLSSLYYSITLLIIWLNWHITSAGGVHLCLFLEVESRGWAKTKPKVWARTKISVFALGPQEIPAYRLKLRWRICFSAFISESENKISNSSFWNKAKILFSLSQINAEKKSFCFPPGSFNWYAGISCSPKVKTETGSCSNFRFRLCSTPRES